MIAGHAVYMIACVDDKGGLGKSGTIPWSAPKDMRQFRLQTTTTKNPHKQHMVIMGRTTYDSLPERFRPLPGRKNVVLSRSCTALAGVEVVSNFEEIWDLVTDEIEDIYIIGGAQIYAQAIQLPQLDGIWLTKLSKSFDCDVFFPEIPATMEGEIHDNWEDEDMQGTYTYYAY